MKSWKTHYSESGLYKALIVQFWKARLEWQTHCTKPKQPRAQFSSAVLSCLFFYFVCPDKYCSFSAPDEKSKQMYGLSHWLMPASSLMWSQSKPGVILNGKMNERDLSLHLEYELNVILKYCTALICPSFVSVTWPTTTNSSIPANYWIAARISNLRCV